MNIVTYEHRYALNLFTTSEPYISLYEEIKSTLNDISDADLIEYYNQNNRNNKKSLSETVNQLIKASLTAKGWAAESAIFSDPEYYNSRDNKRWRLDFAKSEISVEVAFNHGEAIAWNLIKPVLASELNHVAKAIQTSAGVIVCATDEMKKAGNFDGAVGSFEKFKRYLIPMQNMLTTPILLVGLKAPESFYIDKTTKQIVMR